MCDCESADSSDNNKRLKSQTKGKDECKFWSRYLNNSHLKARSFISNSHKTQTNDVDDSAKLEIIDLVNSKWSHSKTGAVLNAVEWDLDLVKKLEYQSFNETYSVLSDQEKFKLHYKYLDNTYRSSLEQINKLVGCVEQLLKINTKLTHRLNLSISNWESSVKNYLNFIEFYKSIQNVIAENTDFVNLKLKLDRVVQSNVKIIQNYDFENVQAHVGESKSALATVKSSISEIEAKFKSLKQSPADFNSYLDQINKAESQGERKTTRTLLESELDELLFSTQRPISKQSSQIHSREPSNASLKVLDSDKKLANSGGPLPLVSYEVLHNEINKTGEEW